MIKCPICSSENPDTERFCRECGQRLPAGAGSSAGGVQTAGPTPADEPEAASPSRPDGPNSAPAPPPAPPTGLSVTAAPVQPSPSPTPAASPVRTGGDEPSAQVQPPPTQAIPLEQEPVAPPVGPSSADEPVPQPSPLMEDEEPHSLAEIAGQAEETIPDLGPEAGEEASPQISPETTPIHPETADTEPEAPIVGEDAPLPVTDESPTSFLPAPPAAPPAPSGGTPKTPQPAPGRMVRDTVNCPRCGVQNDKTFRFCKGCGSPLPAPVESAEDPDVTSSIPARTGGRANITETAGTGPLIGSAPTSKTPPESAVKQETPVVVDTVPSGLE
ncbi:MAG: hypothetical protein M3Y56_07775, partial [Armatimonadota bacterium]|nr:hypothetical protein [Armatimonadota bacterium]